MTFLLRFRELTVVDLRVQLEHRVVVDAIASRDEAAARAAMRLHIENARKRVFDGG